MFAKYLAIVVSLLGLAPAFDVEQASADGAAMVAYAALAEEPAPAPKPKPEPEPEPDGKPEAKPALACECQDGCKCGDSCACVGCKLDGSCCNCGKAKEWKFVKLSKDKGEYRLMQGTRICEARKYERKDVRHCNGRMCWITMEWLPVK
jgi:hypothetical protein